MFRTSRTACTVSDVALAGSTNRTTHRGYPLTSALAASTSRTENREFRARTRAAASIGGGVQWGVALRAPVQALTQHRRGREGRCHGQWRMAVDGRHRLRDA